MEPTPPSKKKAKGAFILISKGEHGETIEREIEDLPAPEKGKPDRDPTRDPTPTCENLRGGMYPDQSQLLHQQQTYSSLKIIQQARQRSPAASSEPTPASRSVPAQPCGPLPPLPTSGVYASHKPRALEQQSKQHGGGRPSALPSLPKVHVPRGRGRHR
jgi:hypothetical protein